MDSLKVIANDRLSPATFRLRVERPDVPIRAGQCFSVGTRELKINREYSMYSAAEDDYVDFLIREVGDGIISPALGRRKPGEFVEVGGPYGEFCLDEARVADSRFVFIASGTGIAPFHSYALTYPQLDYTLIHGVRFDDECYDVADYGDGRYISCITRPASGEGRRITDVLPTMSLDPDAIYYLCGNRQMIVDAIRQLRDGGVPGGSIFTETFF